MSCTKRVFPPRPTQNCFIQAWLLSAVPCTSQQLVCLLQLMHSMISDVYYHKWPATSRAEPVPSTGAAATLKHPKLPLLAATSIRCGSFGLVFFSVQTQLWGQDRTMWEEPLAGHRGALGTGRKVLVGVPDSTVLGDCEHCALISSRGLLTHNNHSAAYLVGVQEPASLRWTCLTNTLHLPLGTRGRNPAFSALWSISVVKLRVWYETRIWYETKHSFNFRKGMLYPKL